MMMGEEGKGREGEGTHQRALRGNPINTNGPWFRKRQQLGNTSINNACVKCLPALGMKIFKNSLF
jgi:hypothetical protein